MAERCTQAGLASSPTGPTPSRSASDPCLFGAHRARIRLIGHQRIGRDFTEQDGLEVLQGLSEFRFGIHYKGSVRRDRLPDRLAPQDEQFQGGAAGILVIVGADLEPVAPGDTVACSSVIGVCVDPGPGWPPTSPAITRTSAPASAEATKATWSASM